MGKRMERASISPACTIPPTQCTKCTPLNQCITKVSTTLRPHSSQFSLACSSAISTIMLSTHSVWLTRFPFATLVSTSISNNSNKAASTSLRGQASLPQIVTYSPLSKLSTSRFTECNNTWLVFRTSLNSKRLWMISLMRPLSKCTFSKTRSLTTRTQ